MKTSLFASKTLSVCSLIFAANLHAEPLSAPANPPVQSLDPVRITATAFDRPAQELAQPWTVFNGALLNSIQSASLGSTLDWQPGIASTHFTAGASRPVIRGQEGQRVRILSNGLGSQDLSNTSADHAVTIDSRLVDQIEVLRGPANLLYGGNAIGGVVNVVDGRIADKPLEQAEGIVFSEYQSVSKGKYAGLKADVPAGKLVVHVDGIFRETEDYAAPAFSPAAGAAKTKTVENSDTQLKSGAFGVSYVDEKGHLGIAYSHLESNYGVLTEGGKAPFIDLEQDRITIEGKRTLDFDWAESLSGSYAYADYAHKEFESPTVLGTGFELDAHETRWELKHAAIGSLQGIVGLQLNLDKVHTPTAESIFAQNNVNRVENHRTALFVLEEMPLNERARFEFGGRIEFSDFEVSGTAPLVRNRDFTTVSSSGGLWFDLFNGYSLAGNLAYAERAPAAEELYSNGKHEATESFNIGNDRLSREKSIGIDITLRRDTDAFNGTLTFFTQHFDNFIFQQATGRDVNEDGVFPVPPGDDPLTERRYTGVEAHFYGFESSGEMPLWENSQAALILRGMADYTRAKNKNSGKSLPRIAPLRIGSELEYRFLAHFARLEIRHAFKQTRFDAGETATPAYTLVNLRGSYQLPVSGDSLQLYGSIENLTDELATLSSSFRKEKAPLPGRSFNVGLNYRF